MYPVEIIIPFINITEVGCEYRSQNNVDKEFGLFARSCCRICHFYGNDIENDIDPREINSIEDHNKIIKYMSDLATLFNAAATS